MCTAVCLMDIKLGTKETADDEFLAKNKVQETTPLV